MISLISAVTYSGGLTEVHQLCHRPKSPRYPHSIMRTHQVYSVQWILDKVQRPQQHPAAHRHFHISLPLITNQPLDRLR